MSKNIFSMNHIYKLHGMLLAFFAQSLLKQPILSTLAKIEAVKRPDSFYAKLNITVIII